ncbi:MAG: linear amide C-N hydrolase, partial [Gemmataceae bacterium]
MSKYFFRGVPLIALVAFLVATGATPTAVACTRAVYLGKDQQIVTGRTMDWMEDMQTNLWIFPRGMKRDGGLGKE